MNRISLLHTKLGIYMTSKMLPAGAKVYVPLQVEDMRARGYCGIVKSVYPDPPRRSRRLAGEAPQCAIVEDIQRRLRAIKKQTCPYCGKTFSGYKGGNCAHHIRKSLSF
jgi:hypothetical protein